MSQEQQVLQIATHSWSESLHSNTPLDLAITVYTETSPHFPTNTADAQERFSLPMKTQY